MVDSKRTYDNLKNEKKVFNLKDLKDNPETFFKTTAEFFKRKFQANSISHSELPERLLDCKSVYKKTILRSSHCFLCFWRIFQSEPDIVHRAGYGALFENYLLWIFRNSANKKIILKENENLEASFLEFQQVFLKSFQTKEPNNMSFLESQFPQINLLALIIF